jgi:hypothetical protein
MTENELSNGIKGLVVEVHKRFGPPDYWKVLTKNVYTIK